MDERKKLENIMELLLEETSCLTMGEMYPLLFAQARIIEKAHKVTYFNNFLSDLALKIMGKETIKRNNNKLMYAKDTTTKIITISLPMLVVKEHNEWAILQDHDDIIMEAWIYNMETKEIYNSYLDMECAAISQDWLELTGKKLYYNIIY